MQSFARYDHSAPESNNKRVSVQGNRIWSLRLLKAGSTSWGSGAINSDRGCRSAEEPASVRSFARRKGSSAVNHLPDFSYAIALAERGLAVLDVGRLDPAVERLGRSRGTGRGHIPADPEKDGAGAGDREQSRPGGRSTRPVAGNQAAAFRRLCHRVGKSARSVE